MPSKQPEEKSAAVQYVESKADRIDSFEKYTFRLYLIGGSEDKYECVAQSLPQAWVLAALYAGRLNQTCHSIVNERPE